MTPQRARDYLRIVTDDAWHNRQNDEPLRLTFSQTLDRKRWRDWCDRAAWALIVFLGVYGAACVIHTTISIVQWWRS